MALTPEEIAKSLGIQYTPGMSYEDFQAKVHAAQGGAVGPTLSAAPPVTPPASTQDYRAMAMANMAPPVEKKIAPPPPKGLVYAPGVDAGPAKPSESGGGVDDLSIAQIQALGGRGSAGGWHRMEAKGVGEAYGKAFGAEEGAAKAETEANKGMARVEGDVARMRAGTLVDARQQAMDAEANRQKAIADHFAESRKLAQDMRDTDVDPDSYYGQGASGVIKRGLMILATSLGGYAAGLRGGPNTVQDQLDKDIERFVQGQKAEYQKKAGLLQQSDTRFGQLMQKFGDERAAENALKADLLGAVEAQGQGMVADAKGGQIDAAGQKALAGVGMQRAQREDAVTKYAAPVGQMTPLQAAEWKLKMQGQKATIDKTVAETEEARAKAAAGAGGKGKKGLPPGVISQMSSIQSAQQALDDEIALAEDKTVSLAERNVRSKRNLDALALEIPHAFTGGVPTPEQQHETRNNLPPTQASLGSAVYVADRVKMLKQQKAQLEHKMVALKQLANQERAVGDDAADEGGTPASFKE